MLPRLAKSAGLAETRPVHDAKVGAEAKLEEHRQQELEAQAQGGRECECHEKSLCQTRLTTILVTDA